MIRHVIDLSQRLAAGGDDFETTQGKREKKKRNLLEAHWPRHKLSRNMPLLVSDNNLSILSVEVRFVDCRC